tara:strand:+ start:1305 stop:1499 length:195 start_codon:yes stop_codon:yes gene_type:complete
MLNCEVVEDENHIEDYCNDIACNIVANVKVDCIKIFLEQLKIEIKKVLFLEAKSNIDNKIDKSP